jgi:plastocyanin
VLERFWIFVTVALLVACGSSSSPVAPAPMPSPAPPGPVVPPPPAAPPTITISATGFSPLEITVGIGARVTFVNGDRVAHDIGSGIDHNSRECPEIDVVGFLLSGQRGETFVFEQTKTCRFHDHMNIGVEAYQGRIVVQ